MPAHSPAINVEIPVLPHVKNLLLTIYGNEPIKLHENNLPGKELQFIFMDSKNDPPEKIFGETIALHISHDLAPYYRKFRQAFSFGCYFEKQFNILLFIHTEAQKNCGVPVLQAIKTFYKLYNINEEFYTLQRALEAYRRFKAISKIS